MRDRLRVARRVAHLVRRAVERQPVLIQQAANHRTRFIEDGYPITRWRQRDAVGHVLVGLPPGADPQHQAPAADLVERRCHVRHDGRMPVGVAEYQAPETDSRCLGGQSRQDGPALQHRS
jgi:hypothetical protein